MKTLKVCKRNNKIQINQKKKLRKNSEMKFDLQQIIIKNNFEIVTVMINKIPFT